MGKNGKKIKKNIKNQQAVKNFDCELQLAKEEMQRFIESEEYDEALGRMAELVKEKIYDAELVYKAAYCYFMLCDYERAAQWLENVLIIDADNIEARVLLARLCILEDRIEDGLDIYEFVVENCLAKLTADQQEEMRDVLDFYLQYETEKIEARPALAAFCRQDNDKE